MVDAIEATFHRNTLGSLLPYDSSLDPQSIFYSQFIMNIAVAAMYASSRRAFYGNKFKYANNGHNTGNPKYKHKSIWRIPQSYMSRAFNDGTDSNAAVREHCDQVFGKKHRVEGKRVAPLRRRRVRALAMIDRNGKHDGITSRE